MNRYFKNEERTSHFRSDAILDKNSVVIYLVESSKGLVSLQRPPIATDNNVVVMLGSVSDSKVAIALNANILACRSHTAADIENCRLEIIRLSEDRPLIIVTTDDTFNAISYSISQSLKEYHPTLILFDHLKNAGLTYREKFNLMCFIRFRRIFMKFPLAFVPIVHSNGVIGYKLNLPFSRTIYFDGLLAHEPLIEIRDRKVVILIPLVNSFKYREYLNGIEGILLNVGQNNVEGLLARIAIKLHPRCDQGDREVLAKFNLLSKCYELDSRIPLELFNLSGKIIINFDSSFENCAQVGVFLLAKYFGYSDLLISNMTGEVVVELIDVEKALLKVILDS